MILIPNFCFTDSPFRNITIVLFKSYGLNIKLMSVKHPVKLSYKKHIQLKVIIDIRANTVS